MKPSRGALFYYFFGVCLFSLSGFLFFINPTTEHAVVIPIGLAGLAIMWIIGIQYDLYQKEEAK